MPTMEDAVIGEGQGLAQALEVARHYLTTGSSAS